MDHHEAIQLWLTRLCDALAAGECVSARLSKPHAAAGDLKSIDLRPILVKRAMKVSVTYHHRTRDIVKNYVPADIAAVLMPLLQTHFATAFLCSTRADVSLQQKGHAAHVTEHPPQQTRAPELSHDRAKNRLISSENKPYLHALGIADAAGKVHKNAQDKFRQINKYIELLDGLIRPLPQDMLRVVDMGAGKGYLTFALYDYVTQVLGRKAEIIGVEYRADLVQQCNAIAQSAGFTGLRFVQGSIADYDCAGVDMVIALHACDTATDDALHKAVVAGASLIVVAPCCHKQIRRAMGAVPPTHALQPMLRFGTYQERMAEMLTDAMRTQLLELRGYRTNLFEFISDAHTPKNVMIVASKHGAPSEKEAARLRAALAHSKAEFGIAEHYLERLLGC